MILRNLRDLVSKGKRKKLLKLAVGIGVVAAVGVATGILFAQKSGKETREDLRETLETIKDTVQKKAETVKDAATHSVQGVHNVIKDAYTTEDISNGLDEAVKSGILFAQESGKEARENLKETLETIKDTVQKKAETGKDSAAHAAQEVSNGIKNAYGKTEGVRKDIKDGYHEIKQDIHKTAENISKELNKPVK